MEPHILSSRFKSRPRRLQRLALLDPQGADGVAGHAPVAARAQAHAADLGAVGQTRALELLAEEAAIERREPMLDGGGVVLAGKCVARQHVDFARTETITQHIEEEEIVQLIRPDKVFRLLPDMPLASAGTNSADGRVHDVAQDGGGVSLQPGFGRIAHQTADECLGNARVDAVHAHVVAVVGGPAQGQFRQVSRTDDDSSQLVGEVHEYLRALTGLRVLIRRVVLVHVVTDVFEVPDDTLGDIDFPDGHPEVGHQLQGVVVSAVGGAETGHGDAHDSLAVVAQLVESTHAGQQRQGAVEPAADTQDNPLGLRVEHALDQSHRLNAENGLASVVHIAVIGKERHGGDVTVERERLGIHLLAVDDDSSVIASLASGRWALTKVVFILRLDRRLSISTWATTIWLSSMNRLLSASSEPFS